jgi:hypothetical protein
MGTREILVFHTFSLPWVELEGHFTYDFVAYVYETGTGTTSAYQGLGIPIKT